MKFCHGYILPLIDYGSVIWGSTSSSNLERLSMQFVYYEQITVLHLRIFSTNWDGYLYASDLSTTKQF